jgi:hypothetical protein
MFEWLTSPARDVSEKSGELVRVNIQVYIQLAVPKFELSNIKNISISLF